MINALFKVNWPLWGPALFMSVALAALRGCILVDRKIALAFFHPRHPRVHRRRDLAPFAVRHGVSIVRPCECGGKSLRQTALTMLAMAAGSYCVAVVGVARSRCGEYLNTPEFFRWLGRLLDRLLDPAPEAGLAVPLAGAGPILV